MTLGKLIDANGPFFCIIFAALSLVSLTLIVWRIWLNHNAKTDLAEFVGRFREELARNGRHGALQFCEDEPGMIPKVFAVILQTADQGKVATRNAVANLVELEILPDLNFLLPLILVFAKLAPMFGLLGTVWGMIKAFSKIAAATTKVEPAALANDIGMALYTTAEGLLIAIPLIFAYTMFRERIGRFELDLQRAAQAAMGLMPLITGKAK